MSPTPCARCGQPHPRCAGHVHRDGGRPCRKAPVRGADVCTSHGGAAPQVRAAAARRTQEAAAAAAVATLGLPVDITPTEALLEEVRWTAGHVHWLRQRVAELADDGVGREHSLVWGTKQETQKGSGQWPGTDTVQAAGPSIWYELYARERQHLVTVCGAALKAGVEERRVRLAEQQGDLVATAIRRILDALNLSPEQHALVGTVVPRELRLIAGGHP